MDNVYVENEALTVENRALVGIVQSQKSRIESLERELAEEKALSADLARAVALYCRWEHSSLKNYMEKYPDWKAP